MRFNNLQSFGAAVGLVTLLSACAVGPDYVTPEHPVAPQFSEGGLPGVTTETVATSWWRGFKDDRLNSLIEEAAKQNLSIVVALARVNESRALRQEAFLDLFPKVTAAGAYTKSLDSTARMPNFQNPDLTREIYRAGGDASWEVDLFGRVRREVEQKGAEEESSIAGLEDAMRVVVADVATNYFTLRGNQASLEVARRNAKAQEESVKLTEAQAQSGMISELDVSRAKAQLSSTLAAIPAIEAAIKVSIHRLGVLLGKNPDTLKAELSNVAPLPRYDGALALGDPGALLKRRPDVRAAERAFAAATAGIGIAEGDYFPKINFVGSLGFEARTPSNFGIDGTRTYSFGPSITWQALNMGGVVARVHASKARAEGAAAQYEQAVIGALEEVENALSRFGAERQRRDNLRDAAKFSAKAAELALDRYKEGSADFLTVIDAQRTELIAEEALSQSETQLAVNLVTLYKALGGGWE